MTAEVDRLCGLENYLRARILLVCDFRLGMGKEELSPPAVCCVIFQSLGNSLSGSLGPWLSGIHLHYLLARQSHPEPMLGVDSSVLVLGKGLTRTGGAGPLRFMPRAFFSRRIRSTS